LFFIYFVGDAQFNMTFLSISTTPPGSLSVKRESRKTAS
jgi:hypothetical protein